MLKKTKLTYRGINQDITKSKRSPEFYFDAENILIQATDTGTTGSVTNVKGNVLVYSLASGQTIIGNSVLNDYLVLFSTDNAGTDKITRVYLPTYTGFELFSGDLNFSTANPIETESYYESEDLQKVYWVDGVNQLRHINIISDHTYTSDEAKMFDIVPEVNFSAPYVSSIDYGGLHTSGMIQYAYNLVKISGSQSAISPFSELYPLNKNLGGGKLNEYVGKILNVTIDSVDTNYDIIRLYAIKYTSYNEQPTISVIAEESIGGNTTFTYSDDGRTIRSVSQDQLTFLGGVAFIPSTITSKYNRLILGNIKELYFDVAATDYDTRSYRFPASSTITRITNASVGGYDEIQWNGSSIVKVSGGGVVPETHDCITADFDTYKYQQNSTTIGTTGTNIDVKIVQKTLSDPRNVLKSNEIYRLGIEFFNNRGQSCAPKWICDFKTPEGNLDGNYNTLEVTIKNTSALVALGVVGWRVLRVERTEQDKTILCQGIVNPLIFQDYKNKKLIYANTASGVIAADNGLIKLPAPFMRNMGDLLDPYTSGGKNPKINKILHGSSINLPNVPSATSEWPFPEIMKHHYDDSVQNSYEETRMFHMYSPDITFTDPKFSESLKFKVVANVENTISNCGEWCKQYFTEDSYKYGVTTGILSNEVRADGVISLFGTAKTLGSSVIEGKAEPNQNGVLGGAGGTTKRMNKYQYYRSYNFKQFATNNTQYNILGTPTVYGNGESSKVYSATIANIEDKYKSSNHLYSVMTDRNPGDADRTDDLLISINSVGAKALSIVESNQTVLENILTASGISGNSTGLIEVSRTLDNQYGGNTYESRSRNSYLRIGKYLPIATTVNQIDQAGDTFVGIFRLYRIVPNTTQILDHRYNVLSEIVEFPVESSIDLSNRSDFSNDGWDAHFQPTYEDFNNYNRVYSQQAIFNKTAATPFTFKERKVFENRVNATKVKTNGELVDSWTDILVNEELYVDGKYGAITKLIQNNDVVYFFQENAVGILEIQPRVQTVGTDGTIIELGRGTVLYNYRYFNTNTGCLNKLSVFKSQNSVYYIDITNKSINCILNSKVVGLSDIHGLHSFMYNNVDYDTLKTSNYVVGVFDQVMNNAYFTTPNFTIMFNEQSNSFVSRFSFIPKTYIYSTYGVLTSSDGRTLWKHGVGNVGSFYGTIYPSSITLSIAPESDADCIFNNGEFKSEVSNGSDLPTKTLSTIECWNEYLDSGEINLVVGANIRRKFRDWNFFIPRDATKPLQRMRGNWLYMKLGFDNANNERLVLHDMIISYEPVYKV